MASLGTKSITVPDCFRKCYIKETSVATENLLLLCVMSEFSSPSRIAIFTLQYNKCDKASPTNKEFHIKAV